MCTVVVVVVVASTDEKKKKTNGCLQYMYIHHWLFLKLRVSECRVVIAQLSEHRQLRSGAWVRFPVATQAFLISSMLIYNQ